MDKIRYHYNRFKARIMRRRSWIISLLGYFLVAHLVYESLTRISIGIKYKPIHRSTDLQWNWSRNRAVNREMEVTSRNRRAVNRLQEPHVKGLIVNGSKINSIEIDAKINIAIGLAITSKVLKGHSFPAPMTEKLQFFYRFLPSFCRTVTPDNYKYSFYLGYDINDVSFTNEIFQQEFLLTFMDHVKKRCPRNLNTSLKFVQCNHSGKPVWAQNAAMMEAYLDNADYYYRINDDTVLASRGWEKAFIETLRGFKPQNVGVVGPNHKGGNVRILTYDFVHRTHIDILGYYYPRVFTDWFGDNWMSSVYGKSRTQKIKYISLSHTREDGRRYTINTSVYKKLNSQIAHDSEVIARYLNYTLSMHSYRKSSGNQIISMSLWGKTPRYLWGAIRNAQLAPIFFPGWKLRIYILNPNCTYCISSHKYLVPLNILRKLVQLKAELVYINDPSVCKLDPRTWRYLVIDDSKVEYFLIRDADARLSDREAGLVNEWMDAARVRRYGHCIRDHWKHAEHPVVDGLWGGFGSKFRECLNKTSIHSMLLKFYNIDNTTSGKSSEHSTMMQRYRPMFLLNELWPRFANISICHDSVSCEKWPNSISIPHQLRALGNIGQKYDEHQQVIAEKDHILQSKLNRTCDKR